ncbi:MAG: nucleoside deaminase [Planctomycetes bacterium]|nr:nucleoside deaminase [Planctomycetota bacterium]
MLLALAEAERAAAEGEVPVGAVLVLGGRLVSRARNRCEAARDATAHAELLALREGLTELGAKRLEGTTLYCTLEPCLQCCGALLLTRVERVVFGPRDPKFGGVRSLAELLDHPRANHRVAIEEGVRAEESRSLLTTFFRDLRARAKARQGDPGAASGAAPLEDDL